MSNRKNSFLCLSSLTLIISLLLLIGGNQTFGPLKEVVNDMSNLLGSGRPDIDIESMMSGAALLFLSLASCFTISIFLGIYYAFNERKIGVIISAFLKAICGFLFLSVVSKISSLASVGYEEWVGVIISINDTTKICSVVVLLGLIYDAFVLLHTMNIVHVEALQVFLPGSTIVKISSNESTIKMKQINL